MAKFSKWRILIATFTVLFLIGSVLVAISILSQKPPVEKIEEGRKLIAKAVDAQANIYSPKELGRAQSYWQEAMAEWKLTNGKSPIVRNFSKSSSKADLAIENAQAALSNAQKRKKELKAKVEKAIPSLRKTLQYIEYATNKLPLNHNIRKNLSPLTLALNEVELAYGRNDLVAAMRRVESIGSRASDLKKTTTKLLETYFSSFDEWVALDREMRRWSEQHNSVSLVVDKFARKCIVYRAGKKYKEFDVELGVNWLGDKARSGDMATPEGRYRVTGKRSGNRTIYHKSLEINYPNAEDLKRFEQAKRKGSIPKNARIGGSIAIHGGGGRGIDWTQGCVALENSDMDILYSLCPVGTPVAIIGSLEPLESLFKGF